MKGLTEIRPDIYRLVIPFLDIYTTVFIIKVGEGAVLFDTATYPDDIDNYITPELRELGIDGDMLKAVVISHDHRDHAGGLARFTELYPKIDVYAGSVSVGERIPDRKILTLHDGDKIAEPLYAVSLIGHTEDCVGIWDKRTNTLLSADGLQLYGIYGSGYWGSNISYVKEHLDLCSRLQGCGFDTVIAAHDYHPCGYIAEGKEAVCRYIDECANAILTLRGYIADNPDVTDNLVLARAYNATSGLPKVGAHVFERVRNLFFEL